MVTLSIGATCFMYLWYGPYLNANSQVFLQLLSVRGLNGWNSFRYFNLLVLLPLPLDCEQLGLVKTNECYVVGVSLKTIVELTCVLISHFSV